MIIFRDILKTDSVRHATENKQNHKMPKVDDWVYLQPKKKIGEFVKIE